MNNVKELATAIVNIDWTYIQMDKADENTQLEAIRQELTKMSKADAVNLLLEVMEAKVLNLQYPKTTFAELLKFDRMRNSYLSFGGNQKYQAENDDPALWQRLLIQLDTMAKYKDNRHFGLPMGEAGQMIGVVAQQYSLTKKTE